MLHSWLYDLLICGLICSLIQFFHTDGKSKPLLETGCACIMLLAFLSPIMNFTIPNSADDLFDGWTSMEEPAAARIASEEDFHYIIKQEYAAYIFNAAEQMNLDIEDVSITTVTDEFGTPLPYSIVYTTTEDIPSSFKKRIENELGVPSERQVTHEIP